MQYAILPTRAALQELTSRFTSEYAQKGTTIALRQFILDNPGSFDTSVLNSNDADVVLWVPPEFVSAIGRLNAAALSAIDALSVQDAMAQIWGVTEVYYEAPRMLPWSRAGKERTVLSDALRLLDKLWQETDIKKLILIGLQKADACIVDDVRDLVKAERGISAIKNLYIEEKNIFWL